MLAMTREETAAYGRDGYILRSGLLSREEVGRFRDTARVQLERENREGAVMSKGDKDGKATLLKMWTKAEDDQYGLLARDERLVDLAEDAVGKPIYLYSHKMTMKQPQEGGAWEWHQDYGYWYHNGCLYPDMASCYVAVDRAHRGNGCLQVIRGSHRMGRIEHGRFGEQTGADPERVNAALERLETVFCEMEPGTGLFFHSNLLHASSANTSERPRWSLICCYNAARNDPYKESHHPRYTPLSKVGDDAILAAGHKKTATDLPFLNPDDDRTTGATSDSVGEV